MNDPFLIRHVTIGDYTGWRSLWDRYNQFYGRVAESALPEPVTQQTWIRFFDPQEPMFGLIVKRAGEMVGLGHYIFHRSTTSIAPVCYMQDLFTSEAARGLGVARALIERICEEAKRAGAPRVYWQTHGSNQIAQQLYDKVAERSDFLVYRRLV